MEVSLIITTYNWPQALRVTLKSVLAQSRLPDELIVADDGSSTETSVVVSNVLNAFRIGWQHVWHEDRGVWQSMIKNLAVKYSSGAYLIFIDHDVVLHPEFIADHLSMADRGIFLQGKRVLLAAQYTDEVLQSGSFAPPPIWIGGLGNRKNAFRFPLLGRILTKPKPFEVSLRGGTGAIHRSSRAPTLLNIFPEALLRLRRKAAGDDDVRLLQVLGLAARAHNVQHQELLIV